MLRIPSVVDELGRSRTRHRGRRLHGARAWAALTLGAVALSASVVHAMPREDSMQVADVRIDVRLPIGATESPRRVPATFSVTRIGNGPETPVVIGICTDWRCRAREEISVAVGATVTADVPLFGSTLQLHVERGGVEAQCCRAPARMAHVIGFEAWPRTLIANEDPDIVMKAPALAHRDELTLLGGENATHGVLLADAPADIGGKLDLFSGVILRDGTAAVSAEEALQYLNAGGILAVDDRTARSWMAAGAWPPSRAVPAVASTGLIGVRAVGPGLLIIRETGLDQDTAQQTLIAVAAERFPLVWMQNSLDALPALTAAQVAVAARPPRTIAFGIAALAFVVAAVGLRRRAGHGPAAALVATVVPCAVGALALIFMRPLTIAASTHATVVTWTGPTAASEMGVVLQRNRALEETTTIATPEPMLAAFVVGADALPRRALAVDPTRRSVSALITSSSALGAVWAKPAPPHAGVHHPQGSGQLVNGLDWPLAAVFLDGGTLVCRNVAAHSSVSTESCSRETRAWDVDAPPAELRLASDISGRCASSWDVCGAALVHRPDGALLGVEVTP